VAQQLEKLGFPNVFALKGGWTVWEEGGYPTEPKK
jgi:3-mercaptopyruvate sulfurtransferase SseA